MRMEERNMEMNTPFLFSANGVVQKAETGCEKLRFFSSVDCRKRGGDIVLYNACRFAGVSLAGRASQHWTIIHQTGTDVA